MFYRTDQSIDGKKNNINTMNQKIPVCKFCIAIQFCSLLQYTNIPVYCDTPNTYFYSYAIHKYATCNQNFNLVICPENMSTLTESEILHCRHTESLLKCRRPLEVKRTSIHYNTAILTRIWT
jgi:hypothetical protein